MREKGEFATVTEREARMREHAAFEQGARWRFDQFMEGKKVITNSFLAYRAAAKKAFPLPTITRPRVVRDGAFEFRVDMGQLQARCGGQWVCIESDDARVTIGMNVAVTPARVKLWADLIANPNETVEEDT